MSIASTFLRRICAGLMLVAVAAFVTHAGVASAFEARVPVSFAHSDVTPAGAEGASSRAAARLVAAIPVEHPASGHRHGSGGCKSDCCGAPCATALLGSLPASPTRASGRLSLRPTADGSPDEADLTGLRRPPSLPTTA